MAQTPISVTTGVQGFTNTTLYTVPAGKTAVVRAIVAQGANTGNYAFTISKYVSGQSYPINYQSNSWLTPATGGTQIKGANLIAAPVTLGANEAIRIYPDVASCYNLPNVSTATNRAVDGSVAYLYFMTYGNSIYMASGLCASGVFLATSSDAVTWTQQTSALPFGTGWNYISCAGSTWVATNQTNSNGTVYYSTNNGVSWLPATVVPSGSGVNINALDNNGTTFIASATNGKIYYSSNGSTWTESTSFYTAIGSTNIGNNNVGWTGSHFIVETTYGALATTDFTTWYGFCNTNFGGNVTTLYYVSYSPAYSKYYTTRANSSVPNIHSSTNGILWTNLATSTSALDKVCCAGSNTVLIATPATGSTIRWKSTNGTTFSASTDVGSYSGPVYGLANGYFLTMQNNGANDACALSTDPTVSTGTTRANTVGAFVLNCAAADPSSGKWAGVGIVSTAIYLIGGTSGTNIGATAFNASFSTAGYGVPTSVAWSAADSSFYMLTDTGYAFKFSTYNGGMTNLGPTGMGSSTSNSIQVVGTTIYGICSGNDGVIWTSSTLTGGSSWSSYTFPSSQPNSYDWVANINRVGGYYGECLATNGTDLVWTNTIGNAFALTPSVGNYSMRMPPARGCGTVQTINSNQFMYGGYCNRSFGEVQGYFTSTNVITTYGSFASLNGYSIQSTGYPANKVGYVGGAYYLSSYGSSRIWKGTTVTNIPYSYGDIGGTIAGNTVVNPSLGWSLNGTSLVSATYGNYLTGVCKTTTPDNFLYAATASASIVEIS